MMIFFPQIGSVRANDSDIDDNQRLTYTIVSGAEGKFILECKLSTHQYVLIHINT